MELLDRRSKSGWEAHAGWRGWAAPTSSVERSRDHAVRLVAPESATGPEGRETVTGTFSDNERTAMRRALALAASDGVPLGPNPRVGCVLLDPHGPHDRRGSPPRRRYAARRGRRARPGRRLGPGRHGGRHARAVQPHRTHRALFAGAGGGRSTTGGRRPARRQPGRGRRRRDPPGRRRRGRDRPPGRRGAGPQPGVDLRHRARPPVRHLEVRHHPRRAQRRRRRHEPLGLQPGGAARHPSPARPVRHDAGRHRARSRSTTRI